jgi:sodium-dependent dicarboxylate transporter 2/3/5
VLESGSDHHGESSVSLSRAAHVIQWMGLLLGPVAAVAVYAAVGSGGPDAGVEGGLSEPGRRVLGLAVLMAVWWLTEALPVSVTAILPAALLPLLKVGTIKQAAAPYADDVIFLFMGGFLLGEALQKTGLHRRVALTTVLGVGSKPGAMVGGVMLATALLSMWVSNTATTVMMIPIGLSIVALVEAKLGEAEATAGGWNERAVRNFSAAMVLGIAYAASIGGIATPVGSPPNLIMREFADRELHRSVSFLGWMTLGVPIAAVMLPACWWLLTRVLHRVEAGEVPGGRTHLLEERRRLGRMSRGEWTTLVIFVCTAGAWVFREPLATRLGLTEARAGQRPLFYLTDSGIALIAALALFLVPIRLHPRRGVLRWVDTERLPWGILLLFGGGLSIADAMGRTGVDLYIGAMFEGLGGLPFAVMLFTLIAAVVFVGELASNAAAVTALMPVLAAAGGKLGVDPMLLMLAATLGASCGFMLPVATPPNAIAFATGRVTQHQMVRAGFLLDWIGIVVVSAVVYVGGRWVLGGG